VFVLGQVDDAHAAFTQFFNNSIVRNRLADHPRRKSSRSRKGRSWKQSGRRDLARALTFSNGRIVLQLEPKEQIGRRFRQVNTDLNPKTATWPICVYLRESAANSLRQSI